MRAWNLILRSHAQHGVSKDEAPVLEDASRYFPVFTKSRISLLSRVSAVLIEYISDI
jgi:hypothetical protein